VRIFLVEEMDDDLLDDDFAQQYFGTFLLPILVELVGEMRPEPIPQHTSILTGKKFTEEMLETESAAGFHENARMTKDQFVKLIAFLKTNSAFTDSRWISAEEKMLILIRVLKANTLRDVCSKFQHSLDSISRVVHETVDCLLKCQHLFMRPAKVGDILHDRIALDPKFFPFFEDCLGALDGSHVPAVVPENLHGRFRNRKGLVTQNVLGACNFDMVFEYDLCGWEGSAHDGRVLGNAHGLPAVPNRYRLGDAGYALSRTCLTPYRGVRYHLKEWVRTAERPQNKEELFNLRHSSLRNVIERVFGFLKTRFPSWTLCKHGIFHSRLNWFGVVFCCIISYGWTTFTKINFMLNTMRRRSSCFTSIRCLPRLPDRQK